ncbi:MAG: hypothetical protein WBP90_09560 [Terracidiphilus sp.]
MTAAPRIESEHGNLAASRPRVVVNFSDYTPPFDVLSLTERLLASVPPRYLLGLREVVLTNKIGLSRARRRSVTKSRGRKVKILQARGLYHPAWKGKQAWIEIFVDSTFAGYEKGGWQWLLRFGYFRENALGGVLFHEIGHHIDATLRPEFREKEDIADDWSKKLGREWFRKERPLLRRILRPFMPLLRVIAGTLAKKYLTDGSWSRSKYESYMKKIRPHKKPRS